MHKSSPIFLILTVLTTLPAAIAQQAATELIQSWLLSDCKQGQEGEWEAQLARSDPEVVLALVQAAQNGPSNSLISQIQAAAGEAYDQMAEYAKTQNQPPLNQTRTQFVADHVEGAVTMYRSRALAGLAITGGAVANSTLQAHAAQSTSPFQDLARLLIAKVVRNFSAASFQADTVAVESIVTAYGSELAIEAAGADSPTLPTSLSGTRITLVDSAGRQHAAPLFYVSATQVNYQIPERVPTGKVYVRVQSASGLATGIVEVVSAAPGLFSVNGNGKGTAAASAVRVSVEGSQTPVTVFSCPTSGTCSGVPIDLAGSHQVALVLYSTGVRRRSSLNNVVATADDVSLPVLYAGPQGQYPGLDQVNVLLPADLIGKGEVSISLVADGRASNPVTVTIE